MLKRHDISMKANVCIVTFPLSEAGYTPLSNLLTLFSSLSNKVYLVSGGDAFKNLKLEFCDKSMEITHIISSKLCMRLLNFIKTQLKILHCVIRTAKYVDFFVFFIGGEAMVLPVLALKLLRRRVLLLLGGVASTVYLVRKDTFSKGLSLLTSINFELADKIVIYSPRLIQEANLAKYCKKVVIAHEHFVDFNKFSPMKDMKSRSTIVGYIGRLSLEKGVQNLIAAIPLVLKKRADARFIICGEGSLASDVEKNVRIQCLESVVKFVNGVGHDHVPDYLNELRLLVLPSFTEGLPNILLEAMACGTPVLATPVGGIPDVIKNGETGFLLNSNDPCHISNEIVKLLDKPELLEKVSRNACKWVRENFSGKKTLKAWQRIMRELNK
jgi:glycosyltransferase involved in cell wall biosynthesis